jgi:ABC-type multidrug transport system ATPase subunit
LNLPSAVHRRYITPPRATTDTHRLGGSGSGKTTLLNQIAHRGTGLPVERGDVVYHSVLSGGDKGVDGEISRKEVKKRIGFVRQQDYLVQHLTGTHLPYL